MEPTLRGEGQSKDYVAAHLMRWAEEDQDLQRFQKAVVLGVVADPEPCNLVVLQYADGPVDERDANRVDGLALVDLLELQAWMSSVLSEEAIGFSSEFSRFWRQHAVRRPEARRRARCHRFSGSSG